MDRRASITKYIKRFSDTLGYGIGDTVSYIPMPNRFLGTVIDIDPTIRKIYVDWAGCGNVKQHDADELQPVMIQDPSVREMMSNNRMSKIASQIIGDIPTTEFLDKASLDLLNKQFANELANAALYNVFASWFEKNGYPGFRAFFNRKAEDESTHAEKVYKFIVDAGEQVEFPAMSSQEIPGDLVSLSKLFLKKETETTKNWQIITEAARNGHNAAFCELCQWFMKEQMEEESLASVLLQKVLNAPMSNGIETIDALLREEDPTTGIKTAFVRR